MYAPRDVARWDDEADGPQFAKSGRFGRMMRIGGLAASVAGSAVARRIGTAFKSEEERAAALRDSLVGNAGQIVKTMGEMKGAAMKLGQMLSVAPEALPREFLEEMKALQKDTPPMPFEMVTEEFEKATGQSIVSAFRYFDPTPIGAASIGQVHEARLFDGRRVAVKVQYPGIADTLESDLRNLGSLMTMGRVVADKASLDAILDEVRSGILEEADYEREAKNLQEFGAILAEHPKVVVPKVVAELSAERVLTMEFIQGTKLDVAIDALSSQEEKDALGYTFSEIFVWMFHERFVLHADPHPGNFLLTEDGRIAFLDFGCMRRYEPEFCDLWIDLLVAKWQHAPERLPGIFEALGYRPQRGYGGPTERQLSELCEIVSQPFLYDRDFDWGRWQPQKEMEQFVKGNLDLMRWAAPPAAVFYFRVAAGVWGFLQRSKVRGNWHQLAQETARRRGRLAA